MPSSQTVSVRDKKGHLKTEELRHLLYHILLWRQLKQLGETLIQSERDIHTPHSTSDPSFRSRPSQAAALTRTQLSDGVRRACCG